MQSLQVSADGDNVTKVGDDVNTANNKAACHGAGSLTIPYEEGTTAATITAGRLTYLLRHMFDIAP